MSDMAEWLGPDESLFETEEGHIVYSLDNDGSCEIRAVQARTRGQGFGTRLMESFLEAQNRSNFYLDAYLVVGATMDLDSLLLFYKKFGFVEAKRFPADEHTPQGEIVVMELQRMDENLENKESGSPSALNQNDNIKELLDQYDNIPEADQQSLDDYLASEKTQGLKL